MMNGLLGFNLLIMMSTASRQHGGFEFALFPEWKGVNQRGRTMDSLRRYPIWHWLIFDFIFIYPWAPMSNPQNHMDGLEGMDEQGGGLPPMLKEMLLRKMAERGTDSPAPEKKEEPKDAVSDKKPEAVKEKRTRRPD
jgi:hypothetical protein